MVTNSDLFKVGAHDVDQFGGAFVALILSQHVISHVQKDMIFDKLRHQAVDCAAYARDQLQNVGTAFFFFEGALDCLHLAADPAHTVDQLGFFAGCVRQISVQRRFYEYNVAGGLLV